MCWCTSASPSSSLASAPPPSLCALSCARATFSASRTISPACDISVSISLNAASTVLSAVMSSAATFLAIAPMPPPRKSATFVLGAAAAAAAEACQLLLSSARCMRATNAPQPFSANISASAGGADAPTRPPRDGVALVGGGASSSTIESGPNHGFTSAALFTIDSTSSAESAPAASPASHSSRCVVSRATPVEVFVFCPDGSSPSGGVRRYTPCCDSVSTSPSSIRIVPRSSRSTGRNPSISARRARSDQYAGRMDHQRAFKRP